MFRKSKTLKDTYASSNSNLHFNSNNSLNINTSNNNNSNNNTTSTTSTTKHNTTKTHQLLHNYKFKQIHLSNSINIFKPNNKSSKSKGSNISHSKTPTHQKMTKSNTIVYKTLVNSNQIINTPQKITIPSHTITDIQLSYNKQIMEKDLKIKKLEKELIYYKSQYMKLNICNSNNNHKHFSPMKTPLLNKKILYTGRENNEYVNTTIQQSKNSFELKGNQTCIKKQHERELSERITNFYTPKANELIRNLNLRKHRSSLKQKKIYKGINFQNSLSITKTVLSIKNKVHSYSKKSLRKCNTNNNKIETKEILAMTIPNEYLNNIIDIKGNNNTCESSNNNSNMKTVSNINYADNLNRIISRMNKIVNSLFIHKET